MPLRLHPDVTSAATADGTVLLHLGTGRYWQLNATGAVLRHLLDGDGPDRVAAALATRHGIEADRAARDVHAVVGQLRAAQLVISS